jgi:hypothetical protein
MLGSWPLLLGQTAMLSQASVSPKPVQGFWLVGAASNWPALRWAEPLMPF